MANKTGSTMTVSRGKINIGYTGKPLPDLSAGRAAYQISVICNDGTSRQWTVLTKLDLYDDSKIKSNVGSNNKLRNLKRQGLIDSNTDIEVLIYDPFETLLDQFHAFLLNEGFSTKSAKSYLSRFRRGFKIYQVSQAGGKTLETIYWEFLRADNDGKQEILDHVDEEAILKFGINKERSYKDICSATSKFRDYLDHLLALTTSTSSPSSKTHSKKKKKSSGLPPVTHFAQNKILRRFKTRVGSWDRFYLNCGRKKASRIIRADDRCFPIRIYNSIFTDKQYRGWREAMLLNVKFITGPNPASTIALKDVNYLRIDDASHEVYVEAFGAEHLVYNEVFDSSTKTSTYSPLIVDPANELREISIDHTIPMESFYKQSDGSHKLPPQMKLLSDDVLAYIISNPKLPYKDSVKACDVANGYGHRFDSINGLKKDQLKTELKDFYLVQMNDLRIMHSSDNSSKSNN